MNARTPWGGSPTKALHRRFRLRGDLRRLQALPASEQKRTDVRQLEDELLQVNQWLQRRAASELLEAFDQVDPMVVRTS